MTVKSQKFVKTRASHKTETAEDYVEMVLDLVESKGEARLIEMAKNFGVSPVTVQKIISRLQKEKLVISKPYRAISLTPKGKRLAAKSRRRHQIVYQVLRKLGVSENVAQIDAEGMEHHASAETLSIFRRFLRKR